MIPERFSVLGFFYPGMNPVSHKKCVAISGNFPECIFVSRFPGSILVKNGASGYPFWDSSFYPNPNVLMPCCHSGTILGSNGLGTYRRCKSSGFIPGTIIPNKNNVHPPNFGCDCIAACIASLMHVMSLLDSFIPILAICG